MIYLALYNTKAEKRHPREEVGPIRRCVEEVINVVWGQYYNKGQLRAAPSLYHHRQQRFQQLGQRSHRRRYLARELRKVAIPATAADKVKTRLGLLRTML